MKTMTIRDDSGQDHSYSLTPHPPTEGIPLAGRILDVVGVPASKLLADMMSTGSLAAVLEQDLKFSPEQIERALQLIISRLTDGAFLALIKSLLRYAQRDNKPLSNEAMFDMAYQANYGELAEALLWVIRENGMHRFLGRLPKAMGKTSP